MKANNNINTSINNYIGYEGKVNISVFDPVLNKNILTTSIHNTGKEGLFQFFATCLTYQWNIASTLAPNKIILFSAGEGDDDFRTANAVTPTVGIPVSVPPFIDLNKSDSTKQTTKFQFRVPTSLIDSNATNKIDKIGLYQNLPTPENPLAYIILDNNAKEALKDIKNSANLVIIVDWYLTITNNSTSNGQGE